MPASHSVRALMAATAAVITVATSEINVAKAHAPDATEIALASLLDAEFAFARMSLEQGIRAAFLANFAAEGIVFEPAPIHLREAWSQRPAPADPKASRLEWQPAQAGVARSGDMGFTTGPWKLTDARRPGFVRHGVFFSVWQRDKAGTWRVSIDIGITTPETVDFVPLGEAPRPTYVGKTNKENVSEERKALLVQDTRTFNVAHAYEPLLANDARLHRDGVPPIAGRKRVAQHMAAHAARIDWLPFDVRIARSADMAATYGQYHASEETDGVKEGYYVHLWLRDASGRWRLAYDIATTGTP
ncbi:MAG TPA: nuclear transport factor 2 family protein [Casimicrobiaceae bacterium]|nr:nuclear transport factor 2 family protein [Casimicrobiaceae bacterium]